MTLAGNFTLSCFAITSAHSYTIMDGGVNKISFTIDYYKRMSQDPQNLLCMSSWDRNLVCRKHNISYLTAIYCQEHIQTCIIQKIRRTSGIQLKKRHQSYKSICGDLPSLKWVHICHAVPPWSPDHNLPSLVSALFLLPALCEMLKSKQEEEHPETSILLSQRPGVRFQHYSPGNRSCYPHTTAVTQDFYSNEVFMKCRQNTTSWMIPILSIRETQAH